MDLSLYTGKILAGGTAAVVGTGGVVVCVKNPEWLTSSKTSQNEQPTTPDWMAAFGLEEICKDSKATKSCQLSKKQVEKLGFVLGTGENSEKDSVHLKDFNDSKKVSLQWKEIDDDGSNFPFKALFTIGAGDAALKIQKSNTDESNKIEITSNSTMQFRLHKKSSGNTEKYYFKKLEQTDKEKNAGMNCNESNSCSLVKVGTNVNGLTGNHTITKVSANSETSKYPDGFKYKVSTNSLTAEDGYYKLVLPENGNKWKLEKVDDLFTKWDRSVIETGTWNANEETSTKSIKVSVSQTDQKINGSGDGTTWTWECEIKATTSDQSHTFTLTEQINTLKGKLGITDPASAQTPLSEEIKKQRKIFVENCANNRGDEQKGKINGNSLTSPDSKLQSTITLSTEGENSSKKFKTADFDNLFKGTVKSTGT